jgi:hypothetical protein
MSACAWVPAQQERARTESILGKIEGVVLADVECGSAIFAGDELCAEVVMKDGARLHFSRLGFNSFGPAAKNIVVDEAGGLEPRVRSCNASGSPNFRRENVLGHHFEPPLIDVNEAVHRYRAVLKEVQYWPQCPQFWEVQDRAGANFRYCARKKGAAEEPPRPADCR